MLIYFTMSESVFFFLVIFSFIEWRLLPLFSLVSQGQSYSKADGSSYTTIYPCSCQPRGDGCGGQVKVVAEIWKVYDNGVVCQKTSVRVWHG